MESNTYVIGSETGRHITFKIFADRKISEKMKEFYYGLLSENNEEIPDIMIYLGDKSIFPKNIKKGINIRDGTIISSNTYKFLKWKMGMENLEKEPIIWGISKWKGYDVLNIKVIRKLLYIVSAAKGIPLVHCSVCVNRNNDAFIFVAGSGVGKSYMVRELNALGLRTYADEIAAIHDRNVYQTLTGIPMFYSNLKNIKDNISIKERLFALTGEIIMKVTGGLFEMPIYYYPRGIQNYKPARIKHIFVLENGDFKYSPITNTAAKRRIIYQTNLSELQFNANTFRWDNIDFLKLISTYDKQNKTDILGNYQDNLVDAIDFEDISFSVLTFKKDEIGMAKDFIVNLIGVMS